MFKQQTLFAFFQRPIQVPNNLLPITPYRSNLHYYEANRNLKLLTEKHAYLHYKALDGYLFVASDDFYHFFVINLINREDTINHQRCEAGVRVAEAEIDDDGALISIKVNGTFQRQRIGSNLIKFITERIEKFHVYGGQEHNSRYRLTEDGMALIQHCLRMNILLADQFLGNEVPPSPQLSQTSQLSG